MTDASGEPNCSFDSLDSTATVALFDLTGVSFWLRSTFVAIVYAIVLEGVCSLVVANLDKRTWGERLLTAGMILSVAAVLAFIASRQPYAGILCFSLLVIFCIFSAITKPPKPYAPDLHRNKKVLRTAFLQPHCILPAQFLF